MRRPGSDVQVPRESAANSRTPNRAFRLPPLGDTQAFSVSTTFTLQRVEVFFENVKIGEESIDVISCTDTRRKKRVLNRLCRVSDLRFACFSCPPGKVLFFPELNEYLTYMHAYMHVFFCNRQGEAGDRTSKRKCRFGDLRGPAEMSTCILCSAAVKLFRMREVLARAMYPICFWPTQPHMQRQWLTLEGQRTRRVICVTPNGSAKRRSSQRTGFIFLFVGEIAKPGVYPPPPVFNPKGI